MTTTSPTIPAWLNVEAIVDPALKARADRLTERFTAMYDEVLPLCREAVEVQARLDRSESEVGRSLTEIMRDALDKEVGIWKVCHELNGYGRLNRAIFVLSEMFSIALETIDPAALDEAKRLPEVSE